MNMMIKPPLLIFSGTPSETFCRQQQITVLIVMFIKATAKD